MDTPGSGFENSDEIIEQLSECDLTIDITAPDITNFDPTEGEKQIFFKTLVEYLEELGCDIDYNEGLAITITDVENDNFGTITFKGEGCFFSEDFGSVSFPFEIARTEVQNF